jgi:hypothetical protein
MKGKLSKKSLVSKARKLRDHLEWARSQIYIAIVGYLFFGWCWMKGMRIDHDGQRLDQFVVLWTLFFIFRLILTIYRRRKFRGILRQLEYNYGMKLKNK